MLDLTAIIVAVITQLPASVLAFLAWRSSKRNGIAGKETRELVNGHMHEFIATTKELSRKIGHDEGKAEEKISNDANEESGK